MTTKKLSKEQMEKLAAQQLKLRENQAAAQARRRAKLKEQGKVQISFMVDKSRAEAIKAAVKSIENKGIDEFAVFKWEAPEENSNGKAMWAMIFNSMKHGK